MFNSRNDIKQNTHAAPNCSSHSGQTSTNHIVCHISAFYQIKITVKWQLMCMKVVLINLQYAF